MREKKKFNLKDLSTKVILTIQFLCLITILILYAGVGYVAKTLYGSSKELLTTMQEDTAQAGQDAMLSQAEDALQAIAMVQSEATDLRFEAIGDVIDLGKNAAEEALNGSSTDDSLSPMSNSTSDSIRTGYMIASSAKDSQAVQDEIGKLSSIGDTFEACLKYNEILDAVYLGTENGLYIKTSMDQKYEETFDPRERNWYTAAMADPDKIVWIETYVDYYGKLCITAAETVKDTSGNPIGVIAADIRFDDMMTSILADGLGDSGISFMLGKDLDLIAYKDMYEDGFDPDISKHFENADEVCTHLEDGDNSAFFATLDGKEIYMTALPLEETGWYFCTSVMKDQITKPIRTIDENVQGLYSDAMTSLHDFFMHVAWQIVGAFVLIWLLDVVLGYQFAQSFVKPIKKLTKQVSEIGQGDFEHKIEIDREDEIGELSRKFNTMQDDLKNYTENLAAVTSEKERIATELGVANQIQADMLPRIFPPFPDKESVDIYAMMDPAKEVGGDFYDFFLIDDDHLAFVIADVSGKGVPAALFMVISKTLIKNRCSGNTSPAEVLADVNNQLCEGNEAEYFVTAWIGILELSTGKMVCANAGHEYPVLRDAKGNYAMYKDKHGFVMGGMKDMRYKDYELQLEKNGGFFVYTDGVPEASNINKELYGTDRMLQVLNSNPSASPHELLAAVKQDIADFVGEADQFDDLTMVGVVWRGNDPHVKKMLTSADTANLAQVQSFVEEGLEENNCPMDVMTAISVCVEEIFVNIAHYAYPGKEGDVQITMSFSEEEPAEMTLQFLDEGIPFNPLEHEDPDITGSAEEREIGGLGIFMVKKTMDDVQYRNTDGKNILRMKKKLVSNRKKKEA